MKVGLNGWMDERCFRPLFCTVKADMGGKSWVEAHHHHSILDTMDHSLSLFHLIQCCFLSKEHLYGEKQTGVKMPHRVW